MKVTRFLALGVVVALVACSKKDEAAKPAEAATPATPPLVTVNGEAVSQRLFDDYVRAVAGDQAGSLTPEQREQIKENLVRTVILAQQAEKDGVTKEPEVASRLELQRLNTLQQAMAARFLKDRVPTEAELRAEFDSQLASTPLVEYQARHILVDGEDVALKAIQLLEKGEKFDALARRLSTDKQTAAKGGDLGWFSPSDAGKPFADALALLKKGEFTKQPIRTPGGWHVVQLLNTRDRAPPAFDDVKQQVQQIVLAKKFKTYADDIAKTSKIDPPIAALSGPPSTAPAAAPATAPAAATPPATN
jgi:peptidyl-prolyl cis-trans isomerase C